MASTNDLIKRLIDAGLSFTQMTQAKAEDIGEGDARPGQLRVERPDRLQELIEAGPASGPVDQRCGAGRGVESARLARQRVDDLEDQLERPGLSGEPRAEERRSRPASRHLDDGEEGAG